MSKTPSRQSFLGAHSDEVLKATTAGIVGLGGGGSHIAQQLAHVGVGQYSLFDPQRIEDTNLNRLIGATVEDVRMARFKTDIARRLILGIRPWAQVDVHSVNWKSQAQALRDCDVIFGCVDSFADRDELERQARRYLIPYIDIGMDVHRSGADSHISGQVVLSMPDGPCLWCLGILREELLAEEAAKYGVAGPRQQVVWPNGILASTAVGMFVQLVTPWAKKPFVPLLEYDGNRGTITVSNKLPFVPRTCPHFSGADNLGDPFWKVE